MASVYILYSKKIGKFYTGSCKDLSERLKQHTNQTFADSFTSKAVDWEIFFNIDDLNYEQARKIEKHIKRMKSAVYIRNLKKYPEMVDKLKEKYA